MGSSLSTKLILGLIAILILISAILGYRISHFHRKSLERIISVSAIRTGDTLESSLVHSMLENRRDAIAAAVVEIGREPGIRRIRIFNKAGRISFSDQREEIGTRVDQNAATCRPCHSQAEPPPQLPQSERSRIYTESEGQRVLELLNVIENQPACSNAACHGHSPQERILGVLEVSMSLAEADRELLEGESNMLRDLVVAILVLSGALAVLIWLLVHRPIHQLKVGTKRVAEGDLNYKIPPLSRDELGELSASFNRMTDELGRAQSRLEDSAKTLELRVEEKTAALKGAHKRMIQVERLASMGKLAAVVAHEINNPLAGILTSARLLLKRLARGQVDPTGDSMMQEHLKMIASESARCGEIVRNLLQFGRQSKRQSALHDLNSLIKDALRLVRHKIAMMVVEVTVKLDEQVGAIMCNAQEIRQALLAVLINACEATAQKSGAIEVGSRLRREDQEVDVWVRDNGVGMDAETRSQIFEPFFSTKDKSSGVGLGLAVVSGIIGRHGGRITVESQIGQGTVITISLPTRQEPESVF